MDQRITVGHSDELQALRGVAALCVMIHHALRVLGPIGAAGWMADVVLNAHAAIVIFFVLSGFVLGRSLMKRGLTAVEIGLYYCRRMFRVYPALWVACTVGLVYYLVLRTLPAPHFAAWAARHYDPAGFGPTTIVTSYLALSPFLDPPLWTIFVELVASALLPFVVLAFVRVRHSLVPLLLLLAAVSFFPAHSLHGVLTYLVDFALGAALAVHGERLQPRRWAVWLALPVLLFFRQLHPWTYDAALPGLVEGLAATVVIAGIAHGALGVLSHRWLIRLGDISYSLYLLHLPIAYAVARLVDHYLVGATLTVAAPIAVATLTAVIAVPLSALSYRFVERPGIALGQRLLAMRRGKPADGATVAPPA